jgi:hypothetical protein
VRRPPRSIRYQLTMRVPNRWTPSATSIAAELHGTGGRNVFPSLECGRR